MQRDAKRGGWGGLFSQRDVTILQLSTSFFFQSKFQNFEYAAEVLSELWSKVVIEGNSVVAEYIKEEPSDITITKSEEWKAIHVRESQYLLQIVKFTDQACCRPFESSYSCASNSQP